MKNKEPLYQLLKKQNSRMIFKAINYMIFSPLLIPVSIFALPYIIVFFKLVIYNYRIAIDIFKKTFSPYSYPPLKEYIEECSDIDNISMSLNKKENGVFIASNCLLIKTKNSFDILPQKSVVWVYYSHYTTNLQYRYSNIKIQTNYADSIVICTDLGKKYNSLISVVSISAFGIHGKMNNAVTCLEDLIPILPNAVFGYSKDLEAKYQFDPKTFI